MEGKEGNGEHGGVCVGENPQILTTHCQSGEWEYIYEMYARTHTYAQRTPHTYANTCIIYKRFQYEDDGILVVKSGLYTVTVRH